MRDFSTPRTYILSAYRGKHAAQDRRDHAELSCDLALHGVPFRECEGTFDGKFEQSFVVVGAANERVVKALAIDYGQKCYLVIAEHDRQAYFVDPRSGYHAHAGRFVSVGEQKPSGDYTLVDGNYFEIVPSSKGSDLPGGF